MEIDFLIAILVSSFGIGIALWFIVTKLRSKLVEVEDRQASQRELE